MCFRPPSAARPKKCPQCGSMNPPNRTTCSKCNANLSGTGTNSGTGNNEGKK
ncbi:MAG: zinc-ribbon domain-containing protein [Eubacteriales bacterium]